MRIKVTLGAVAVAGVAVAFTTVAPASADLVTRCVGTGGAVTVPGDLVVPAGKSCSLKGTTVQGKVRVQSGADLVVVDGTFSDAVAVAGDGYLDATNTAIAGTVTSRGGYGVYLSKSQVSEDYRERGGGAGEPFAYLIDTDIAGQVDARAGQLFLDSSRVSGAVRGIGTSYTDVVDSTLSSTLTVQDNGKGATVCASEVDGNASYTGNTGVQVGSGDGIVRCNETNYFGGNVDVSDNTGGVAMTDNIVRGDLSGTGNDPAPTGSDNRVRGDITGQFVDLLPTPASQARTLAAKGNRADRTQDKLEQRREAAVAQAQKVGLAKL